MITRDLLSTWLDETLQIQRFSDYAPNGLQIEGRAEIRRIAVGVSANAALIEQAIAWQADAIIVHHGFFWRNEPRTIVGVRKRRIAALLAADISLFGVHLPLDAHDELGNNVGLLRAIGAQPLEPFGADTPKLGWIGQIESTPVAALVSRIEDALQRPPLWLRGGKPEISTVAVVTGGGAGYLDAAIAHGAELFVTGEPSEPAQALALEHGIHFVAGGHHATERFGVRALGAKLTELFGVEVRYIDVDNPV